MIWLYSAIFWFFFALMNHTPANEPEMNYAVKICNPVSLSCTIFAKFLLKDDCEYLAEKRQKDEDTKSQEWKRKGKDVKPYKVRCEAIR